MRNLYATVPYLRTIIYFSFCAYVYIFVLVLIAYACLRLIFQLWQLFTAVIIVAYNLYFGGVVNLCVTVFLHSP